MTHELIAHLLGVRREGVTEAACKLQKVGAIAYCHGHITVLDRSRLERFSCECYRAVKKETDRLLPGPDRVRPEPWTQVDLIAKFPPNSPMRPHPLNAAAATLPIRNKGGSHTESRNWAKLA